jgi:hypothetical protein
LTVRSQPQSYRKPIRRPLQIGQVVIDHLGQE